MNHFDSNKTAFDLNSKAISMMERSCFTQAATTLRDAVSILKQSQRSNESLNDTLQKANRRVFNPEQASLRHVALNVIHHDGIVQVPADFGPSELSVIRMESVDIDREEALAILFHNLAISWMFQAETTSQAKRLLQSTMYLLNRLYIAASCPFTMQRFVFLVKNTGNAYVRALEMTGQEQEAITFKTSFLAQLDQAAEDLAASELFTCTMNAASPAA
jgi:hypothetical protein